MAEPTFTLADLAARISERARAADPASSYTATLLAAGVERTARKFGEEAVEAVIAAIGEDDQRLTEEAGDVLYHLLVMLEARKIPLDRIMAELAKRTAQSGHAEKSQRP